MDVFAYTVVPTTFKLPVTFNAPVIDTVPPIEPPDVTKVLPTFATA